MGARNIICHSPLVNLAENADLTSLDRINCVRLVALAFFLDGLFNNLARIICLSCVLPAALQISNDP
jgi:hypothetical protein